MISYIDITVSGQGLHLFTDKVASVVHSAGITQGICNILVQHTSASLIIQENADPSARDDLENWLNRLVPEADPLYTHTLEGDDDMPAHIKSAITASSLSIPIDQGQLALGTWQGIYLWEHRRMRGQRRIVVHIGQ